MSRRTVCIVLIGALAAVFPSQPAHAVVAAAPPGAAGTGYATENVVTAVGGPIEFVNLDIDIHNFTAFEEYLPKKEAKSRSWCSAYKKKKCPVFWSQTIGPGQTQVEGLDEIESGEYTFYCTVHPAMKGTLQVL
jgi:plastocyanin